MNVLNILIRSHPASRALFSMMIRRRFPRDVRMSSKADDGFNESRSFSFDSDLYPQLKDGMLERNYLIRRIVKWLDCTPKQAEDIFAEAPGLKSIHMDSVEEYINFMKEKGVGLNLIVQNPWLLEHFLSSMRQKFNLLSQIGINSQTVPLLKLSQKKLTKVVEQWRADERSGKFDLHGNRLERFCKILHCTAEHLASKMGRHCHLLTHDYDKVSRILSMLLEHGMDPKDIQSHLKIFVRDEALIQARLQKAQETNAVISMAMLECKDDVFEARIEKRRNTKFNKTIDCDDNVGYLAEKLECSREYISCLSKRHPPLLKIPLEKVQQVLDLLFANGFAPNEVCCWPQILSCKIHVLQARLQELKNVNYTPRRIYLLFISEKQYRKLINNLQEDGSRTSASDLISSKLK